MKVLHITNLYPTEKLPGYGTFVKEQIDNLNKKHIDNDIFFINAREEGKIAYLMSIFKIYKVLKYERYDLVHCHHVFSIIVLLLSGYKGKIVVSFLSDGLKEIMLPFSNLYGKIIFNYIVRKSDGLIFKKEIPKDVINNKKCHYLPNGVNTNLFNIRNKNEAKLKLSLKQDVNYILFVSSNNLYRPEKRYDIFLEVLNILKNKNINVEALTLENTDRDKVPLFFNAAYIHLLVSDFEGSPNSIKESLASGVPIVSRDVGNVKRMINNSEQCFVLDTDNANSFAEVIENILLMSIDEVKVRKLIFDTNLDHVSKTDELIQVYKDILK